LRARVEADTLDANNTPALSAGGADLDSPQRRPDLHSVYCTHARRAVDGLKATAKGWAGVKPQSKTGPVRQLKKATRVGARVESRGASS
jgi:hypothetical protein